MYLNLKMININKNIGGKVSKITEEKAEEMYNDSLNGMEIKDLIGYDTSYILKEMDPIMYDCGFQDFVDSLSQEGINIEEEK